MTFNKKLIEIALPLVAINSASAKEKSIRHGHPSNLHRWWSRKPISTARAVIFAQMVDDPSEYIEELLANPSLRKLAEQSFHARSQAWDERKAVYEKAHAVGMPDTSNPEPGPEPTIDESIADLERQRLFDILENLVVLENTNNEVVIQQARNEIWKSWQRTCKSNVTHPQAQELFNPQKLPAFHDPFAGGGALPLEAERLGLESYASDLNPVAVLINKAMIEIPPKFADFPSVNPEVNTQKRLLASEWRGVQGLKEDIRYYGQWMCDEAEKRIGYLYPKIEVTSQMASERSDLRQYIGQKLPVIAWIWARTVKSPNPAFAQKDVPLVTKFWLATKQGKEAFVEPVIENDHYSFKVKIGKPNNSETTDNGTRISRGSFRCLLSNVPISYSYIDDEANAGRMGVRLMALVAEGKRGRVYLSPTKEMETIANQAQPDWKPDTPSRGTWASNAQGRVYGFRTFGDYFTNRQLVALTTFSDLVQEAREKVKHDALVKGVSSSKISLNDGGSGSTAYADAIALYLSLIISKTTDSVNNLCPWEPMAQCSRQLFGRQGIQMLWEFAEANPLYDSSGGVVTNLKVSLGAFDWFSTANIGHGILEDAAQQTTSLGKVISTDPPYFDNVGYADLSDFFYIWLRRSLKPIFPNLFPTLAVPKAEELIASAYRHGSKSEAEKFFMDGMTKAMKRLAEQAHPAFPVTIYYAFKQAENDGLDGTASTGWETFLEAIINAGFTISGTWPMRTEMTAALKDLTNSLASSIALVCRRRDTNALTATRREFTNALQNELPSALTHLQASNIAPVDLAQAAIGPGMAIYSRYSNVVDAQGKPISVRQALALINQTLDEVLAEQEGDFDADTRWALAWFEQSGFVEGDYGVAETLSKAKDTSIAGMVEAGILASGRGKVRLLKPSELPEDWDPASDKRLTAWEMVHQLIRVLEKDGEGGAAQLMAKLGAKAETARELCYRLYMLCERKKRAGEALSYNALVQSWPETQRLARESRPPTETQATLF